MGLALTRREGNKILIGDDIEITIIKLRPGSVTLNVEAPKNIKILRNEVLQRDRENARVKREAASR